MLAETMPPAVEPVSLAEAKAYLRLDGEEEDALIAALLRSARSLCEAFTGRLLIARPVVEVLPANAAWQRLGATPVRAVTGVEGLPADEPPFALTSDAYEVDIDAAGDGWIRVTNPGAAGRVRVSYAAGMADDWNGFPEPLRQGIVRLAAHLHAHRDATDDMGPPAAVAALWRPWRRMRLA